jgi:hypothetical protein
MPKGERPIEERAGTLIDHSNKVEIYQVRNGEKVFTGILDLTHKVYQWGGALGQQVYWKNRNPKTGDHEPVFALGLDEWAQVKDRADYLEFIDFKPNVCYRISGDDAQRIGYEYRGKAGTRYGIPRSAFTIYYGPGLQEAPPPEEPVPSPQASLF